MSSSLASHFIIWRGCHNSISLDQEQCISRVHIIMMLFLLYFVPAQQKPHSKRKMNYIFKNLQMNSFRGASKPTLWGQTDIVLLQNSPLYRHKQKSGCSLRNFVHLLWLCNANKDTWTETGMLRLEELRGEQFRTDLYCWNIRCKCVLCRCF